METAQTLPFQAVLNDVMPQALEQAPSLLAKQPAEHAVADALAGGPTGQDLSKGLPLETLGKSIPQLVRPAGIDPGFQITKQNVPGTPADLKNGEMAFAARVIQRASVAATVALRDAQTVISASRFDTAKPGANAQTDAQALVTAKKSETVTPAGKTTAEPGAQPAAESRSSSDASSDRESGDQHDDSPTAGAASPHAAAGPEETTTAAQPQNISNLPTAAVPTLAAAAGLHGPATAKAAEPAAPQFAEPQGETTARAGESVRDISLRLTNAEQGAVQVRLSERAGELHVSVRTPDTGLTRGLRDALPELMGRLQVNGYRAETWQPGGNGSNPGQDRGQEFPQGNSQQRNSGGQQQQNSQQQQQQEEQTPQWVREMESMIQRSNS